jgi:ABC-type uncharacterized transport system auxiliary subunit
MSKFACLFTCEMSSAEIIKKVHWLDRALLSDMFQDKIASYFDCSLPTAQLK